MAVDTRDKRFSIMGLGQPTPSVLPLPDGAIDTSDRSFFIFLYSGIALGAGSLLTILNFSRGLMRGMMSR